MSILRIKSAVNSKIDPRYIQSLTLELTNYGESFEFLLLGYAPQGPIYRGLYYLEQGGTFSSSRIMTQYDPFDLIIVTNAPTYEHTGLTLFAWNDGQHVAIFTQEDAIREC